MVLKLIDISRGSITCDGQDVTGCTAGREVVLPSRPGRLPGSIQLVQPDLQGGSRADDDPQRVLLRHGSLGVERQGGRRAASRHFGSGQVLNKYPHQLSGGQLQRLLVARALLLDLKILVADEIISMLDASTRIDV